MAVVMLSLNKSALTLQLEIVLDDLYLVQPSLKSLPANCIVDHLPNFECERKVNVSGYSGFLLANDCCPRDI